MGKRVVITGIGPVTSIGTNRESFWNNLLQKKIELTPVQDDPLDGYRMKSRYYIKRPDVDFLQYDYIADNYSKIGCAAKYGILSAMNAIEDAKFCPAELDPNCAVYFATAAGTICDILYSVKEFMEKQKYNKLTVMNSMDSGMSAWVGIILGLHGMNMTINAACTSSTMAIGEAYSRIRTGQCNMAIAGGADYLGMEFPTCMRGFDCLSALTRCEDGYAKPFSEERSGFLFNEGYGFSIVLEELEHARKRNATIYAEISNYKVNSDGYSIVMMPPDGAYITQLIQEMVQETDRSIDYYNAHGTGTTLNDKVEAKMIQSIFGDKEHQPIISATKGILGHGLGAAGVCEAAVTAMSLKEGLVHGNILETPMSNLNIHSEVVQKPIRTAITANFGFGGHNAALMLQKYEDD